MTAVEPFAPMTRDPADAFGLPTWPARWREVGGFTEEELGDTEEELGEWNRAIAEPTPGFLYSVTFLVGAGQKR